MQPRVAPDASPAYSIHFKHYVKTDSSGQVTEWSYVAHVSSKSEAEKVLHSMSRTASFAGDKMTLGQIAYNYDSQNPMDAFTVLGTQFQGKDLLATLAALSPADRARYLKDLNAAYQTSKSEKKDLKPFPIEYAKFFQVKG